MDTHPLNLMNPALTSMTLHVLRAAFAVLVAASLVFLHDRSAAAVPANGSEQLHCQVGTPAPSIGLAADWQARNSGD